METKGKLMIEILLVIVILSIVIFTCANLIGLVRMFSDAMGGSLLHYNTGF